MRDEEESLVVSTTEKTMKERTKGNKSRHEGISSSTTPEDDTEPTDSQSTHTWMDGVSHTRGPPTSCVTHVTTCVEGWDFSDLT